MDRRSFFGLAAGAAVAAPAVVEQTNRRVVTELFVDARPALATLGELSQVAGRIRHFNPPNGAQGGRYEYRSGYPAIDALRSVSGVYRERMEKRLEGRL